MIIRKVIVREAKPTDATPQTITDSVSVRLGDNTVSIKLINQRIENDMIVADIDVSNLPSDLLFIPNTKFSISTTTSLFWNEEEIELSETPNTPPTNASHQTTLLPKQTQL